MFLNFDKASFTASLTLSSLSSISCESGSIALTSPTSPNAQAAIVLR